MYVDRPQNVEIPVNSLMMHTCTKKMLQLVLLVYSGELYEFKYFRYNNHTCIRDFQKILKTFSRARQYLQTTFKLVISTGWS